MSRYILENDMLRVMFDTYGGEMKSIYNKQKNLEYMWNGDPKYWKRTAPVLFPLVGNFKDKQYFYEGKSYTMAQHGFARDREFILDKNSENEIWFKLSEDDESLKIYPFKFNLYLGYVLRDNQIEVFWKVENPNDKTMYFSIGGHPAFLCPLKGQGQQKDYYLKFDSEDDLIYTLVNQDGLAACPNNLLPLDEDDKTIKIPEQLFDQDALIVENNQAHRVSLLDREKEPYITVIFDAPLFGLWSPAGLGAPFICIEPWYGRCDSIDFNGSLEERLYGTALEPAQVFKKSYRIIVEEDI